MIFRYGQVEIDYLKRHDKRLGAAIDRIGMIEREVTLDPYIALVKSIVSQQVSTKAAATVWERLYAEFMEVTPESISSANVEDIQKCGLSFRKAEYIKGTGDAVMTGALNIERLHDMPDEEIITQLSSLRGVGVWTAEMLLIFSLCRPDVVSWGDFAIRRGIMNLYGLSTLTKEQFARYRKRWSPYGSVASLYLWALSVT